MAFSGSTGAARRRVSRYRVTFPTLPSVVLDMSQPETIELIQSQGSHDVAVLSWPSTQFQSMANLKTGVPVTFTWKKESIKNVWVGYVSFVSAETAITPRKDFKVHCVGASFPLKENKVRVFKNKTIPQVAEIIAREYGLQFKGESHPRIFKQITISGQSYWEWLQENARKIGYAAFIEGTALVFKKLDSLVDSTSSQAPILAYFAKDVPTNVLYEDRTLDFFRVMNGEYVEGSELRNVKTVGGVDPVTSRPFVTSKSPAKVGKSVRKNKSDVFFQEQRTGQVAHDASAALTTAEGAAQLARFTTPAEVRGQGDPRIAPYKPVVIKGVSKELDGYWVVTKVKHIMSLSGEYHVEMWVASDGLGGLAKSSFRSQNTSSVGTVNIAAALANGGRNPAVTRNTSYTIKRTKVLTKESGQGFNRTPSLWTAKRPGGKQR